ncbi:MAG TPA: hypothetical protein VFP71_03080 [Candidatus Angelobacter sp.]|nr:hypothetical protein [Candidatus Angelobacter sp.]
MNGDNQTATKADLKDLERSLKQFILEREIKSIRWFIGVFASIQIAYFAITLGAVYFMINQIIAHLPK